jgi:peptidoglycan hydrolase-like protein with peptidoglycan-binding domain
MNRKIVVRFAAASALALGACADITPSGEAVGLVPDASGVQPDDVVDIHSLREDLSLGAEGAEVRAVQEYLASYGYLPNEELAQRYPSWRPLVEESVAELGRFDEVTERAVLALQRHSALPATGIVDADTRDLIASGRCGVPEGIEASNPRNKFAPSNTAWTKRSFKWRVINSDTEVSLTQVRAAAAAAFAQWSAETSITLTQVTSGEDISISFSVLDADDGASAGTLAITTTTSSSSENIRADVVLDTEQVWSTAATTETGKRDVQTVLLHELGHALGLVHSSLPGAIMLPAPPRNQRTLAADDRLGISTLYDDWVVVPGQARDIAVGGSVGGAVWAIGTTPVAGGFNILRSNGGGWDTAAGGAVRITVDSLGIPWIVNSVGTIFRRTSGSAFSGVWEVLPGCAKDIGAGGGAVWVIGCGTAAGGFGIHKWNGSNWDATPGGALRIAVGPTGVPWVVNSAGTLFRRTSTSVSSGSWTVIKPDNGSSGVGTASDVSVAADGTAWIVGFSGDSSGLAIYVWNEQAALGPTGPSGAPLRKHWLALPGIRGTSVGGGSLAWVTNSVGTILRPRR